MERDIVRLLCSLPIRQDLREKDFDRVVELLREHAKSLDMIEALVAGIVHHEAEEADVQSVCAALLEA